MNKNPGVCYYPIKLFFRVERATSDVTRGRKLNLLKLCNLLMDSRHNPLSQIPDTNVRHFVMQVLACMWCVVFSMWMGSIVVFGESETTHTILLAGILITVPVFKTAEGKPNYFGGLGRTNGSGRR